MVPVHEVMADFVARLPPAFDFWALWSNFVMCIHIIVFCMPFSDCLRLKKKHIGVFNLCVGVLILAVKFCSTWEHLPRPSLWAFVPRHLHYIREVGLWLHIQSASFNLYTLLVLLQVKKSCLWAELYWLAHSPIPKALTFKCITLFSSYRDTKLQTENTFHLVGCLWEGDDLTYLVSCKNTVFQYQNVWNNQPHLSLNWPVEMLCRTL